MDYGDHLARWWGYGLASQHYQLDPAGLAVEANSGVMATMGYEWM